ncbi:MAG: hypothetical protein IIB57_03960 [Planctomycetes bacterium]|nr:hypothetical protein [Planctomycetota bacterium]
MDSRVWETSFHYNHLPPGIPNCDSQRCNNDVKELHMDEPPTPFKNLKTLWSISGTNENKS